jgi:WD40 repeat protein
VAALLVVLAVGASAAAVLLRGERDAARAAQGRAVAAEVGRRNELVRAYIQDARVSRASGQVGRRLRGLEAVRGILRAVPSDELTAERRGELRDEAVASMALSDLREAAGAGDLNFLTVDADPTLNLIAGIAFEGSPHLCVRRRDGGSVLRLPPPPGEVRIFAAGFEPTARWLAELVAYSRADGKDRFRVWEGQDGWRQARCVIDETVGVGGRKCWAFHPDGRHLVFVAADAVLRRYDLTDPGRVERSEPRYRSCDPSYSPDGRTLALANPDGIAEFVDAASLRPAGTVTGVGRTNATAWGDTGRFVAFGEVHGAVYLWDVEARAGRYVAGRHGGRVLNIAFGPGGTRFATSADDHETRVWDCRTGGELQRLRGRLIRWAADGRLAVADDRKLTVYEPVGGQLATAPVLAATAEFSPDGRWLAASSAGGVELFAGDTLAPVANLGLDECGPPAFRPDGGELLTFGRFSHVQRWPLAAGNPARLGPARPYPLDFQSKLLGALVEAPQHAGRHAAWSRNGKTLAIVDYRNHRLLVADGTNPDAAPRELTKFFNAQLVAVSPDGAYVACGDLLWSTVAVWRVADGQEVFRVPGHGFAAFDPTGRLLVTGGPLEYRAERVGTWEPVWAVTRDESDRGYAAPAAFAPDGKTVALAPDRRHVRLCAADSGATLATLTHPEPAIPMWLAFAPDGARLAVARTGVDLAVWDLVALRRGLADLGLDWPGDHATSAATRSGALEVVRGSRLPAAEEWPRRWRKMGVYEASVGKLPDAVHAATMALEHIPPPAVAERAAVLAERGLYHRRNGTASAAADDWQAALALVPGRTDAALGLARLWTLGPEEFRNPARALPLAVLAADGKPETEVVLAAAYLRSGRPRDAATALARCPNGDGGPFAPVVRVLVKKALGEPSAESLAAARAEFERAAPRLDLPTAEDVRRLLAEAGRE